MKLFKIVLLHILSVVLSICPVLIFFFINLDLYVTTRYEGIKLVSGGVVLLVIVILKVIGKLKIPSGIALYGIILILSYLLEAIISDLIIFAFLALIGEVLSSICDAIIKTLKKRFEREKAAEITANEVSRVLGASSRGGRV